MPDAAPSDTTTIEPNTTGPVAARSSEEVDATSADTTNPNLDQDVTAAINELRKTTSQLSAALSELSGKSSGGAARGLTGFFSSGLFFMLVGGLILVLAFSTMSSAYAIFSFVLVVLGVAILLFGTGTQSMGEFASDSAAAKYKLHLAGGAGVLAFAVAYGIIIYSSKMKEAFQIERKYFVLLVKAKGDGTSSFDGYAPAFSIAGTSIPVMRRGDFVLAYVPYVESEKDKTRTVTYEFTLTDRVNRNRALRGAVKDSFTVEVIEAKLDRKDGAFDFPVHSDIKEVDMRSTENAQDILNRSGENPDASSEGQDLKGVPPPTMPSASGA